MEVVVATVMMTVGTGDVMMIVGTSDVMIVVLTTEMIAVTGIVMMVVMITTPVLMEVGVTLIARLLPMSTLIVRYARNMAILQVSAGGAMEMTRSRRMMMGRVLTLHHMEWIQTGTPIPAPPTTSQVN
jgi:hypothetical protein